MQNWDRDQKEILVVIIANICRIMYQINNLKPTLSCNS